MRFFRVTPPTVHQMVLNLEKAGADLTQAGRPAEYRGPAQSIRLARTKSAACSTGQNHCDGVLALPGQFRVNLWLESVLTARALDG